MSRPHASTVVGLTVALAAATARADPLTPAEVEARRVEIRAAAADAADAGTMDTARTLLRLAEGAENDLLPEIGRDLAPLGDRAVPALIEARGASASPVTRAWAGDELELLGKRTPGDAVQTSDRTVLRAILRAYGATRDVDALPAVLAFVGAPRPEIRDAARDAIRDYGDRAVHRLREAVTVRTGERPPPGETAEVLARRLFDAIDRERSRDIDALFERAVAARREGRLEDAVAAYDAVLAQDPDYPHSHEAAAAYVDYAAVLATPPRDDAAAASAYLRKAIRVSPGSTDAVRAESALERLHGRELEAHGVVEASAYERALALDPANDAARADLERVRAGAAARRTSARRAAGFVVSGGVLLAAIAGAAWALRRTRSTPERT